MAAQLPDKIVFKEEYLDLYSNPLESYWAILGKERPAFYTHADCKRGYIATWEIKAKQLFLIGVDGDFEKKSIFFGRRPALFTLRNLFPGISTNLVKARWFSGKLRIPQGNMTKYEHEGYNSRFEREIIITVLKGDLLKIVTLDYTRQNLIVNSVVSQFQKKD